MNKLVLTACVLLGLAFADMPYGYYMFLRIAVCLAACAFAIRLIFCHKSVTFVSILMLAIAILYNPIVLIGLDKHDWEWINMASLVVFLVFGTEWKSVFDLLKLDPNTSLTGIRSSARFIVLPLLVGGISIVIPFGLQYGLGYVCSIIAEDTIRNKQKVEFPSSDLNNKKESSLLVGKNDQRIDFADMEKGDIERFFDNFYKDLEDPEVSAEIIKAYGKDFFESFKSASDEDKEKILGSRYLRAVYGDTDEALMMHRRALGVPIMKNDITDTTEGAWKQRTAQREAMVKDIEKQKKIEKSFSAAKWEMIDALSCDWLACDEARKMIVRAYGESWVKNVEEFIYLGDVESVTYLVVDKLQKLLYVENIVGGGKRYFWYEGRDGKGVRLSVSEIDEHFSQNDGKNWAEKVDLWIDDYYVPVYETNLLQFAAHPPIIVGSLCMAISTLFAMFARRRRIENKSYKGWRIWAILMALMSCSGFGFLGVVYMFIVWIVVRKIVGEQKSVADEGDPIMKK